MTDIEFYSDEAVMAEHEAGFDEGAGLSGGGVPIWTTNEGEHIPIHKMESGHLFNAMKMMFNHLAEAHGGQPVWFQKRYGGATAAAQALPGTVAWWVVVMLAELDRRTDIPAKYLQPLQEIREQIFGGPERVKGPAPRQLYG